MKKIMIIEDEKNIILSLSMFLKKENFEIRVETNGIDAIKTIQEFVPDLILLDILLPGMNGYFVCKALKDDPLTRNIPIIFMSAKNQQSDINEAFEVGGSDYIVKPFTHQQIKSIIGKYLL